MVVSQLAHGVLEKVETIAGPYRAVLEGIQADQDFLRLVFDLKRYFGKQQVCHYCSAIQYVVANEPPHGHNSPELLYTRWGATASHRQTLHDDD